MGELLHIAIHHLMNVDADFYSSLIASYLGIQKTISVANVYVFDEHISISCVINMKKTGTFKIHKRQIN